LSGRTGPAGQVLTIVEAYKEGTSIPEPFTLTRLAALHARAMVTATGTVAAPRRGSRSTGTAAFPPISRQSDLPVSAPRAAVPAPAPVTAVFTDPPPTDHELAEARSGMRAIAGAPSIASSS
jgi:hypothetical protein